MPQVAQFDAFTFSLTAGADLSTTALGTRLKMTSTGVQVASASERAVGYLQTNAASGKTVSVRSVSAPSKAAVASKAIAIGAYVYGAASGKVTDASSIAAPCEGVAITAAAADGDSILIAPVTPNLAS